MHNLGSTDRSEVKGSKVRNIPMSLKRVGGPIWYAFSGPKFSSITPSYTSLFHIGCPDHTPSDLKRDDKMSEHTLHFPLQTNINMRHSPFYTDIPSKKYLYCTFMVKLICATLPKHTWKCMKTLREMSKLIIHSDSNTSVIIL